MTDRRMTPTFATLLCLLLPGSVLAQGLESTLILPSELTVHDVGWSQIANLDELGEFFFAVVETIVLVAVFAFHPRANALRQDAQGWLVQVSMFLFGLIGLILAAPALAIALIEAGISSGDNVWLRTRIASGWPISLATS